MSTSNYLRYNFIKKLVCVLILCFSFNAIAQETKTVRDSTSTTHSLGEIKLPDPNSIVTKYEYDPITNRYIYRETLGKFDISYPLFLTPKEFERMVELEERKNYFKEKIEAFSGKKDGSEEKRKNILPILYVNSQFFESIFGGNEIEVTPQGSVEMDLGMLFTKQDNPAFSPQNRSNFTFDFDQRISLSLLGKVGKRLQVTANYDTESTFDFQNQVKLEYTPTEDDIIRSIEVGNVSMPLNSSLIQGAQSLFGVKMGLQFGKTTITGVFSEQRSETRSVNIQGGGTIEDFELFALDYDEDRHFFLAHYFRDNYDRTLQNYPFINSDIQITRLEVWVTNRSNNAQSISNARNIVALQDLGEANVAGNIGLSVTPGFFTSNGNQGLPSNDNNHLNPLELGQGANVLRESIRQISTVANGFVTGTSITGQINEGTDYSVIENARQLRENEYTLNKQLGYISLNQRLSNDEVLAVAFQYTKGGQVFQVGEFANGGVDATVGDDGTNTGGGTDPNNPPVGSSQNLVVKMLKSSITSVTEPRWDLMMKNIYNLGAYRLERDGFIFNILYTSPSPVNFISGVEGGDPLPDDVEQTTLLKVFNMDKLNTNNDPVVGGDGFFDYVPGLTVDTENGRIIFTTIEPFGEHLFNKLDTNNATYEMPTTYNANQAQYVFREMYTTTKVAAGQEGASKNYFQLKGRYKSSGQDGIPIGAFNVPQGSVTVTAGGRTLQEGVDYTVNYQLGRVNILDEALLASNTPIQVSTENNAVFGQQTKRYSGLNVEHKFNDDFIIGGTFVNLSERPITQKSNFGYEPINNTILGFNGTYSTDVPFLTRLVNKLPNIDTDVPSRVSVRAEVAKLFVGAPKGADFDGKVTSYIDDFEGAQTAIDISSPLSWELSSVPVGFGANQQGVASGYQRAKLSWYSIDPVFYSRQRPSGVSDEDLSSFATRRVFNDEIFPETTLAQGQTRAIFTLDLNYDPTARGEYNYSEDAEDGVLSTPRENFGGITRQLTSTNFEQSNVEFIEFWVMDPFIYDPTNTGGKLVFNLGNISEDVLKDGRKQYENGLPEIGGQPLPALDATNSYGARVPSNQSLIYAFDTEGEARVNQDTGYDGLNDDDERRQFPQFSTLEDPAGDNYTFYLQGDGGILERYRNYNGTQGNSPTSVGNTDRGNTTLPTVEDVNRDNTMNTINSYHEYEIELRPQMSPDNNPYISDVRDITTELANGQQLNTRWVRFKVPIYEPTGGQGGIDPTDFRSIRFIRMFMTDFSQPTLLRFGTLDLVRGDYRRYVQTGDRTEGINVNPNAGEFLVSAVSTEETVGYVSPPGVRREELINNNTTIQDDEKSLSLTVDNIDGGDARAVYKNFNVDMRQYENLEMFIHAEPYLNDPVNDDELVAFIRMGNDFTDNFYQIEIPLQVQSTQSTNPDDVWPEANRVNLKLELLQKIKSKVLGDDSLNPLELEFFDENGDNVSVNTQARRIGIKGNPNYGNIRVMMLGVKNTATGQRSGTVWFNELRMSDLKNGGGWAATGALDANLADFATVSASGRITTIGFGGIEQGPSERSQEDLQEYDLTTNLNLGQLLPKKWGIQIPFNYSRGEKLITPQYDPEFLDIELQDRLDQETDPERKEQVRKQSVDYTRRQSFNLIGLRKERTGDSKPQPYDVENFSFSTTYNQTDHHDFEIENSVDQTVRVGGTYDFSFQPAPIEPFKKVKFFDKSKYFDAIKDFNVNLLPTSVNVSSNINRQYNEQVFRDITLEPGSIGLDPLYQRNFLFDWQYGLTYNLTKSLNFTYTTTSNRVVKNFIDENNVVDNSVGVWTGFFDVGDANLLDQKLQLNYEIPFNKIPVLKFLRSTYSYTSNFQWQKGSETLSNITDENGVSFDLGNTVQNSNTHSLNGSMDMNALYKYVGLTKKRTNFKKKKKKKDAKGEEKKGKLASKTRTQRTRTSGRNKKLNFVTKAYNTMVGLVTAVKKVNVNYQENNGTFLPGYLRDPGFAGTLKPTAGFTFGSQADVRHLAARNGWLTIYPEFNQQFSQVTGDQLNIQASIGLLKDLKIDLSATRNTSETTNENFNVIDGEYNSLITNTLGNFTISTALIKTAFSKSDATNSATFDKFRENRLIIARRLAAERGVTTDSDGDGYPDGYGRTNQAVLLPAFLSAYTGTDANKVSTGAFRDVPIPNWDVKYTGLMKLKWFKKRFKRFSLAHGYRSTYTINQYQTNLDFDENDVDALDQGDNFKNRLLFSNVNLIEQFSPLMKIDFEMKNSVKILAEWKKDRALSLSFDNNLLTEIAGNEYILGLGYRVKDLRIPMRIGGKKQILKSDLNFRADFSLRQNETVIRYLDVDNSEVTAGQDIFGFKFTTDYALNKNLTALFFYDHTFSQYSISTAFPQTTIRAGFTLRYNFGN